MLSMNSPVVSFQLESEEAYTKLLQLVEEALESNTTHKAEKKEKGERSMDEEKDKQFKVITNTCTTSVMLYPHVFVLIIMMLIKTNYTWIKIAMPESSWNFVVYTCTTHNWKFYKCILKHWRLFFLRNCMS